MAIKIQLIGANGKTVKITENGEIVIGLASHNDAKFNELAEPDIVYNFYKPRAHKNFIITHIYAYGDKQVSGSTNATVDVYEASSALSSVIDKQLFKFEIGQNEFQPFTDINLLVNEGKFINAKTSDDDVHMNILGYHIDKG